MAEPFLAEIRMFSFDRVPRGWATCDGQLLLIVQNSALYSLIGSTYGGDNRTNFNLPDLRGRVPIQPTITSTTVEYGKPGGKALETLSTTQIPAHTHAVMADTVNGTIVTPSPAVDQAAWATAAQNPFAPYVDSTKVALNPSAITTSGGGQGHNNMQPYQTISFCIALMGIYPSRP
ncbi:hypothetical protein SPSIL_026320 [Sporomusa silvacetica DSM 10669]|uniref:Phage tail collar domain-containing protein n=1 Tax=Sporomusa silvacetica DSM 10669 TaxID=1123289 RepID=A0ABZ3ILC3_9FIRM|nr:tail fiber protein [Sporomusa silvacetica]OZC22991.1 phage tail collar domain protein [Sporomusa silvacetica DSM 10669]